MLSNRSNIPVQFEWKSMATKEDEINQKDLLVSDHTSSICVHSHMNACTLYHVVQCIYVFHLSSLHVHVLCRYTRQLMEEESSSKDTFMERCLHNPSVRDRFPILSHTYQNRKKVLQYSNYTRHCIFPTSTCPTL